MHRFGIGTMARATGVATIGAAIAIAIAIAMAAAVHAWRGDPVANDRAAAAAASVAALSPDPLARELAHCREIGSAAQNDAACKAAWAENRRRFFAPLWNRPAIPKAGSATPNAAAR
jgi:conjugative transfer region protein TrbK